MMLAEAFGVDVVRAARLQEISRGDAISGSSSSQVMMPGALPWVPSQQRSPFFTTAFSAPASAVSTAQRGAIFQRGPQGMFRRGRQLLTARS